MSSGRNYLFREYAMTKVGQCFGVCNINIKLSPFVFLTLWEGFKGRDVKGVCKCGLFPRRWNTVLYILQLPRCDQFCWERFLLHHHCNVRSNESNEDYPHQDEYDIIENVPIYIYLYIYMFVMILDIQGNPSCINVVDVEQSRCSTYFRASHAFWDSIILKPNRNVVWTAL